jgi:hypothetical protein
MTVAVLGPIEAHRDGFRLEIPGGRTAERAVERLSSGPL